MKKWLLSSSLIVVLLLIGAGIYAQTQVKDKTKEKAKTECKAFTDKNKDGICDNHGTANCAHSKSCMSKDAKCTGSEKGSEKCGQKECGKCSGSCKEKAGDSSSKGNSAEVVPASSCCSKK